MWNALLSNATNITVGSMMALLVGVLLRVIWVVWRWYRVRVPELEAQNRAREERAYKTIQDTQTYWEERYDNQAKKHQEELREEREFYRGIISGMMSQLQELTYTTGKALKVIRNTPAPPPKREEERE